MALECHLQCHQAPWGSLPTIAPERLPTTRCTKLHKDGFFQLQVDQRSLEVRNATLSPNATEKVLKWVGGWTDGRKISPITETDVN